MTPTTARASARARATRARRDEEAVSESSSGDGRGPRARTRGARDAGAGGGGGARERRFWRRRSTRPRLEAIIERDYFPDLRTNRLKAALLGGDETGRRAGAIAAVHREMNVERMRRVGSRGGGGGDAEHRGIGDDGARRGGELGDGDAAEGERF